MKLRPRDVLRKKEKKYNEKKLNNIDLTDSEIIQTVLENRELIERPIVINGNRAVIARPPEKVLAIL